MGWLHAMPNFADRRRNPLLPTDCRLRCVVQPIAVWAIREHQGDANPVQQIEPTLAGLEHAHR